MLKVFKVIIILSFCISVYAVDLPLEKIRLTDGRSMEGQLVDLGSTFKILMWYKGKQMGSIEVSKSEIRSREVIKKEGAIKPADQKSTLSSSEKSLEDMKKRLALLERQIKKRYNEVLDIPNKDAEIKMKIKRLLDAHNLAVDEYNAKVRTLSESKAKSELKKIERKRKSYDSAKRSYERFIGNEIPEMRRALTNMTSEYEKLQAKIMEKQGDVAVKNISGKKEDNQAKVVKRGESNLDNLNPTESTVLILVDNAGSGSGFVVNKSGFVVTNAHVVQNEKGVKARKIKVMYDVGTSRMAEDYAILQVNAAVDLALLAPIKPRGNYKPMPLRTDPQLGERIRVFGFPMAMQTRETTKSAVNNIVLSSGNLASLRRNEKAQLTALQIDVRVSPGNSGGPVLDEKGAVLGVVQYAVRDNLVTDGQNFAIPAAKILETFKTSLNR